MSATEPAVEDAVALIDALPPPSVREVAIDTLGYVRLVDVMPRLVQANGLGPEAAIVQAARVSYGAGTKTVSADEVLLRYLFRHHHMTPFEMVTLKFSVKAPLFTVRQWMRHRSGAFNEQSAQYSVVPDEFYVPEPNNVLAQSSTNRQGSGLALSRDQAGQFIERVERTYESQTDAYGTSLNNGIARELARVVLPEGRYSTFYWTVSLRNLFGFLELRMDAAAPANIRAYATAIHQIVRRYCPIAVRAFDEYRMGAVTLSALEIRAMTEPELPAEMSRREQNEWAAKKRKLGLDS